MADRLDEVAKKLVDLDLWGLIGPVSWAVKPAGTAFPYFCALLKGDGRPVKVRLLLLEGWQTVHDFNRTMADRAFGFYSTPMEMPHFELVVLDGGGFKVVRDDPGYMPRELTLPERTLCARVLWEVYGVLLRLESDRDLAVRYAAEKAAFSRVEDPAGEWHDRPLPIQPPRPYVEQISFPTDDIRQAKLLPLATEEAVELDFRLLPNVMTQEPRPRCAYLLAAVDAKTGERRVWDKASVPADGGLKGLWTSFPPRLLKHMLAFGRIPGEVRVLPGRVHRMLHPLITELPFKLSLHERLPRLESALKSGV